MVDGLHLVAVGADHQDLLVPGVGGDELEQPQRRRIGPVQVLKGHHDRSGVRRADQHRRDGVGELELGMTIGGRVRCIGAAEEPAQRRIRWVAQAGRRRRPLDGTQHLRPRPIARRTAMLPTRPGRHQRLLATRPRQRIGHQGRLADPGLAGDQHQTAVAGQRLVQLTAQHPDSMLAAGQRRLRRHACEDSRGAGRATVRLALRDLVLRLDGHDQPSRHRVLGIGCDTVGVWP